MIRSKWRYTCLGLRQDKVSCYLWLQFLWPGNRNLRPQDPLLEPGACTGLFGMFILNSIFSMILNFFDISLFLYHLYIYLSIYIYISIYLSICLYKYLPIYPSHKHTQWTLFAWVRSCPALAHSSSPSRSASLTLNKSSSPLFSLSACSGGCCESFVAINVLKRSFYLGR